MGGAMDLVNGARQIIVMLTHFSKGGECKLLRLCKLPLTGKHVVNRVVTELGIFVPTGTAFRVEKLADGVSPRDLGIEMDLLQFDKAA